MDKVNLIIERDTSTKIPACVPEWEIPVLRQIHGSANVSEDSRREYTPEEIEDFEGKTWEEAYEALQRKYSSREAEEALLSVFPNVEALVAWADSAEQRHKTELAAQKKADDAQAKADASQAEADRIAQEAEAKAAADNAKAVADAQKQAEKDAAKDAGKAAK